MDPSPPPTASADRPVRVFISYVREDDAFEDWVLRLATTLRGDGVDARLDVWHLRPGQTFPDFMNAEVRDADRVLVIGSPQYRAKVHAFEAGSSASGVGWETMLLTSQFFAGHRDKMAVAWARGDRREALPDFLGTQRAHDLTVPDDPKGYEELLEDLLGRRPKPPPLGSPPPVLPREVTPLFKPPSSLDYILELVAWMHARWPEHGSEAIYPSWSEFEAGAVSFPKQLTQTVESALDLYGTALVEGRSGSGKSVLGAWLAYHWSRLVGRRSFWLDLADYPSVPSHVFHAEVKAFLNLEGENLLAVDNAQADAKLVDWVVTRFERNRATGSTSSRLLVLSRPLSASSQGRATLAQRLVRQRCSIEGDAALFHAVALRLLARTGTTRNWTSTDYGQWSREFGGDLIAFGQAVIAARATSARPTPQMAARRIRESYIDPARTHPDGLAILDRICLAASFDLTVTDTALEGLTLQAVSYLIEGGHLQPVDKSGYRHWKLAHAGLGELVLSLRARDGKQTVPALRLAACLGLAEADPYMLGPLLLRAKEASYLPSMELTEWVDRLTERPALVQDMVAAVPLYAVAVDRRVPSVIRWDLVNDPSFRPKLRHTLAATPANDVATFLRCAEQYDPEATLALLSDLLTDDAFAQRLADTPSEHVVSFLKYSYERFEEASKRLLARWWTRFQSNERPSGIELVNCGGVLRLAREWTPAIADEMVAWMNALDHQFAQAVSTVAFTQRLGLAGALRDTERRIDPHLWEVLSTP